MSAAIIGVVGDVITEVVLPEDESDEQQKDGYCKDRSSLEIAHTSLLSQLTAAAQHPGAVVLFHPDAQVEVHGGRRG